MPIIKYHEAISRYGVNDQGNNKSLQEIIDSIAAKPPIEFKETEIELRSADETATFPGGIGFEEDENNFDGFEITKENKEAVAELFERIARILKNPELVFRYLKDLDSKLGADLAEIGISEINSQPQYLIAGTGNFIPGPWPENYQPLRKQGALNQLLLKKENEHQINLGGVARFQGFVRNDDANEFVRDGYVFSEEEQVSKFLLHGKYSHRLFFEIVRQAAASEELDLHINEEKLTQKQLIQLMIFTWNKHSGLSSWASLIDSTEESIALIKKGAELDEEEYRKQSTDPQNYSFSSRSPFVLKSLITCFGKEELPNLSGYLLDSHYKQVAKMIIKVRGADFEGALAEISNEDIYTYCIDAMSTGKNYRVEEVTSDFSFLAKSTTEKTKRFSPRYNENIQKKDERPKENLGINYDSISSYMKEKLEKDFEEERESSFSKESIYSLDSELDSETESELDSPSTITSKISGEAFEKKGIEQSK